MAKRIIGGNFPLNINFNLRSLEPANKATAINAVVRFNNQRIVLSKVAKIEPRYWNTDKGSPKKNKEVNHVGIQSKLDDVEAKIKTVFNEYTSKYNKFPSDLIKFKNVLLDEIAGKRIIDADDNDIISYTKSMIEEMKSGKRIIKTKRGTKTYSDTSHKSYGNLIHKLTLYCEAKKISVIRFEDVDTDFYDDFRTFVVNDNNHTPNYFGTLIKCLKAVMNDSFQRGKHSNLNHKSKDFVREQTEVDTIYLSDTYLQNLYDLNLNKQPHLDNARNLFLIGAYTGLRFSDFTNLSNAEIEGDYLRLRTKKTSADVTIPITGNLSELLKNLPTTISNQRLNEYIKVICELAGLTHKVSVKRFVKGREVTTNERFCDLVTTHTARRSFATNMYKNGVPSFLIMAITGHETEKAFLTYIRLNNSDKAKMTLELMKRNSMKVVVGGV